MYFSSLFSVVLGLGISASAQSIIDALSGQDSLGTLMTLINAQPSLVSSLSSAQNITLFAPSNDAFDVFLDSDAGISASSQLDVVAALLTYHVVNGAFHSSTFTSTPIFPSTLLTNSSYTSVSGGQVVEVVAQNGGVNVFSGLKSKATVTTPDLTFGGGVIHIIDTVLTIPPNVSTTALMSNLTQLSSAIGSAGLGSTLDTAPKVTVFAPTDSAFAAIANTVQGLSASQLSTILEYHVVPAVGYSSSLQSGSLPTLDQGQTVNVAVDGSGVKVNNANVIMADVIVENGVVHVIDSVLSPTTGGGSSSGSTTGGGSSAGSTTGGGSSPNSGSTSTGTASGASTSGKSGSALPSAGIIGALVSVEGIAAGIAGVLVLLL